MRRQVEKEKVQTGRTPIVHLPLSHLDKRLIRLVAGARFELATFGL